MSRVGSRIRSLGLRAPRAPGRTLLFLAAPPQVRKPAHKLRPQPQSLASPKPYKPDKPLQKNKKQKSETP